MVSLQDFLVLKEDCNMELKKYDSVEQFVDENINQLLEKEWLNCLMVGNCFDGLKMKANDWLLAKVSENNKTELIILYRKPWKLLLYSPTNNKADKLFEFTAKEIYKIDANLLGVSAEKEIANKFAKYYCEVSKLKNRTHKSLRILLLTEVKNAKLNDKIIFRKASIKDKPVLIKFIKDFYKEAVDEKYTDKEIEEKFNSYMTKGYYVIENKGKVVCQAAFARDFKKGKSISSVYTPKEERGKGYAYNLVYRISKKALDEGAEYCVLYTDDENPISNHIYEKIGYRRMVNCEDIEFY